MFSFDEHSKDIFLIGSRHSNNIYLQWILTTKYYNVRCNSNIFSKRENQIEEVLLPNYILIYNSGSINDTHLFECRGFLRKTGIEMKKMGYPAPHGDYILFSLGNELNFNPIDLKRLIQNRPQNNKSTKYNYSPLYIEGKDLLSYMKEIENKEKRNIIPIRIGTLFSGIGAFEEAMKQLHIPHEIKFACDNGEIELIPLDNNQRKEYKELNKKVRSLEPKEREQYVHYKQAIARKIEDFQQQCLQLDKQKRAAYVNELYNHFESGRINYVKQSYLANYKINENDFHTDIRFLNGDDYLGKVDILVGGSPCQSFSTFGKKQGLEDARGTLFYDYARIIKESKPKVFIYENVAAIKTNDNGRTWQTMLSVWNELGYNISNAVLNAVDYNHPQLRRRVFIVGIRKDICKQPYQFPPTKPLTKTSTDFLEKGIIPLKYYLGEGGYKWITTYEKHKRRSRVNQDIIGCQTANQQDNWIGDFRIEHPRPEHYTDSRIYIGKFDFNDGKGLVDAVGRKLTPRECLRLMGFSDSFKIVVDDHQAYHQAGNSIVVPVLKEIIKTLLPYLQ